MNTKKSLKSDLGLDSVATINRVLKAAGRPTKVIRSANIEDADEALFRKAFPHLEAGKSVNEAVKLAKTEIRGAEALENEDAHKSSNGDKGTLTIEQKVQLQQHGLAKKQEQQVMKVIAEKATALAEKTQAAKWLYWAAAEGSEQVQQSQLVTKARDFALGVVGGDLLEESMIAELEEQMEAFDFFSLPALAQDLEPNAELTLEDVTTGFLGS